MGTRWHLHHRPGARGEAVTAVSGSELTDLLNEALTMEIRSVNDALDILHRASQATLEIELHELERKQRIAAFKVGVLRDELKRRDKADSNV